MMADFARLEANRLRRLYEQLLVKVEALRAELAGAPPPPGESENNTAAAPFICGDLANVLAPGEWELHAKGRKLARYERELEMLRRDADRAEETAQRLAGILAGIKDGIAREKAEGHKQLAEEIERARWRPSGPKASLEDHVAAIEKALEGGPLSFEVVRGLLKKNMPGAYVSDLFKDAWKLIPDELKLKSGRPRKNPSDNPSKKPY
jgi:hypothetical protein